MSKCQEKSSTQTKQQQQQNSLYCSIKHVKGKNKRRFTTQGECRWQTWDEALEQHCVKRPGNP